MRQGQVIITGSMVAAAFTASESAHAGSAVAHARFGWRDVWRCSRSPIAHRCRRLGTGPYQWGIFLTAYMPRGLLMGRPVICQARVL
jgi:hypothetical protein